jgi:subtilisin family serine protease
MECTLRHHCGTGFMAVLGLLLQCGHASAATITPNFGNFGPRAPTFNNIGPRAPDLSGPRSDPTSQGNPQGDGSPSGKSGGSKSGVSSKPTRKPADTGGGSNSRNNTAGQLLRGINLPPGDERRYEPDKIVVEIRNLSNSAIEVLQRRHRVTQLASLDMALTNSRWLLWRIPADRSVPDMLRSLGGALGLVTAQPSYVTTLHQKSETASLTTGAGAEQYTFAKLHLTQAHSLATGDKVVIAVIDSGIDTTHPELQGVVRESFDALDSAEPPHSHGTAIAGAIVARAKLTGVAPNARLLAIRAFGVRGESAESTTFTVLKSLDWAFRHGPRVINMSFAGPNDPAVGRVLAALRQKGIVLVAAVGNAGPKSPPLFPAADPNVIAVTATDVDDKLFDASNRGRQVAVAAPGVDVLLPAPGGSYQVASGTSFAAAHVSGIVALLLERKGTLTPDNVRQILQSTAKDLGPKGRDDQFGAGLVDAYQAVLALESRSAGGTPSGIVPGH